VQSLTDGDLRPDRDYCADLPKRPAPMLGNYLAKLKPQLDSGKTGVHVLEDGAGALMARAWLTVNAQKSIDVQYFIFSADAIGLIAADELLRAAQRGVKVRLLVDDVLHDGDADFLLAMDAHPNFEIRVYNPNINIGKTLPVQLYNAAKDFRGVNQRMHNKTFIVDRQVVITGGRNIADEYFDLHPDYNFRDRDILLLGGVSHHISGSFQQFWVDHRAVPLRKVIKEPESYKKGWYTDVWEQLHRFSCDPRRYWPEMRKRAANVPKRFEQLQANGVLRWVDNVRFVSDDPGKNDGKSGMAGGGKSTTALIRLVRSAKREVIIQTPYLVTSSLGKNLFAEAVARGIKLTILTNSLASTDSFPSFSGYVRDREALLKTGIMLYESKPDGPIRHKLMTLPDGRRPAKDSIYGLHAKSMVIDGEITVVGTFNLDPRSANLNTECIVVVKDKPLAQRVLKTLRAELSPANAWRITPKFNPDSEAPLSHKWKMLFARPIPRSVL